MINTSNHLSPDNTGDTKQQDETRHSQIITNALLVRRMRERTGAPPGTAFMVVEAALNPIADMLCVTRVAQTRKLERILLPPGKPKVHVFHDLFHRVRAQRMCTQMR